MGEEITNKIQHAAWLQQHTSYWEQPRAHWPQREGL